MSTKNASVGIDYTIYSFGRMILADRRRYRSSDLVKACAVSFVAGWSAMAVILLYVLVS